MFFYENALLLLRAEEGEDEDEFSRRLAGELSALKAKHPNAVLKPRAKAPPKQQQQSPREPPPAEKPHYRDATKHVGHHNGRPKSRTRPNSRT